MKKIYLNVFIFFLPVILFSQEVIDYPLFGKITIYKKTDKPEAFVIFLSGDGGWNLGVIEMADKLAQRNAVVVGIDIVHYMLSLKRLKNCAYPAGDLELLSKDIQRKLNLDHYLTPVLAGYSSGASLAYAALVQAPPNTFSGALTLGFCIDIDYNVNFCSGRGLMFEKDSKNLEPVSILENPWYELHGDADKVSNIGKVREFIKKNRNADLVELPDVGHGFLNEKVWVDRFLGCYDKIISMKNTNEKSNGKLGDLPLIEQLDNAKKDRVILILTGDGGWANIDKDIGSYFSKKGYGVIGFDCLKYFWNKKSPEITARDIERVIEYYSIKLKKNKFVIIGYSMGADVLPFSVNRMNEKIKKKIKNLVFIGIANSAEFEFHLSDWFGKTEVTKYSTKEEIEKIKSINMIFIAGDEEEDSLLRRLDKKKYKLFFLKGGHHLGGNYEKIAGMIESNF